MMVLPMGVKYGAKSLEQFESCVPFPSDDTNPFGAHAKEVKRVKATRQIGSKRAGKADLHPY